MFNAIFYQSGIFRVSKRKNVRFNGRSQSITTATISAILKTIKIQIPTEDSQRRVVTKRFWYKVDKILDMANSESYMATIQYNQPDGVGFLGMLLDPKIFVERELALLADRLLRQGLNRPIKRPDKTRKATDQTLAAANVTRDHVRRQYQALIQQCAEICASHQRLQPVLKLVHHVRMGSGCEVVEHALQTLSQTMEG